MIIYFCDRQLNILGQATTELPSGFRISADKTLEDIESGVNTFECTITWTDETRSDLASALEAGNYILKSGANDENYNSLFQIVETEKDTKDQSMHIYAEDAGLDLLNTQCGATTLTSKTISQMISTFLPSDWSIEVQDAPTTVKTYTWDGDSTCTERLRSVVGLWDCELYYSFRIEGLQIKEKILNVVQRRGLQEAIPQLRLNYDIDRILTKTSIADLVTALNVTGGGDPAINLKNYNYSYTDPVTGDVYAVDKTTGQMRNTTAMDRWSSAIDEDGLWVGSFSYETEDKAALAGQARAELQKRSAPAVNYEVDFAKLPDDVQVGDRINIIDDDDELYLEARILKIETSEADGTQTATIGEYLLRDGGISARVAQLATDLANARATDKVIQSQMQILTDTVDNMFTLEVDSDVVLAQAHLTARLLNGRKDVKTDYDPSWFKWILRSENGERLLGRGYTYTADMNIIGYASTILCRFIRPQLYDLTDHNLVPITDANLDPIQVSFAGLYNQPVVTRNLLKSKLKTLRATPTVEVGDPNLTREVNLYERNGFADSVALFTGNKGGYVVLKPNEDGQPEEILVMDTPDIETAQNVWRWNKEGIGYSSNGYNGTYSTAWTIDGTFVADFIKAGIISDVQGMNSWNMDTGYLITKILRATEYIYMNGTTNSYFKIPFWSDQSEHTGYMELSSNGFLIQIDNSKVKGKTVTKSGSGEGIPGPVTIGFLSCTYEDGGYNWGTDIMPDLVDVYKSSGSTITARTQLGVGDVYIADENNGYSAHFNATGSSSTNPECLLTFPKTIVYGDFYVQSGTKSRIAETKNYDDRALYCYETPTPLFGDIGEAQLDEEGICYVDIDDIFSETIASRAEYQVFLQKEGEGDCWIADKQSRYFVIQGTPDLKVAWELKAKQKDYENYRLEQTGLDLDEYVFSPDTEIDSYIREQEELLYG